MEKLLQEKLITKAIEAMNNAYSVVHNFPVGASVLTKKGNIYHGCNIESVISGMGVCAERSAIDHAVAHGEYVFEAIVVTSKLGVPIKPCGMCLQYIAEFSQVANADIEILMVGSGGQIEISSIKKLLPNGFGPADLGIDLSKFQKWVLHLIYYNRLVPNFI